jgi:hypothetical protein
MKENYKRFGDLVFQIRKISPAYKARMTVSSGLMNIYKQLRALFACVVCSSLP